MRHLLLLLLISMVALPACRQSEAEEGVADASELLASERLPYTIEFVESTTVPDSMPPLQSYAIGTSSDGRILLIGGRVVGLHQFSSYPDTNFPISASNRDLVVINPDAGTLRTFSTDLLPDTLGAFLRASNAQAYNDIDADVMYLAGGYGWKPDNSDMTTFGMIARFPVSRLMDLVESANPDPSAVAALFTTRSDTAFAVTGGELIALNGTFYLCVGQFFDGQYRAFGSGGNSTSGSGPSPSFVQRYTEQIRQFSFKYNSLEFQTYAALTLPGSERWLHRRDGNVIADIDPATGEPRIAGLGGVFPPGIIGYYPEPFYVSASGIVSVDTSVQQKFGGYEAPVIAVWDSAGRGIYRTIFGGISHYYYHQTDSQKIVYAEVTAQGRNDGFPFISDVSTFVQFADGSYGEYVHPDPIADTLLLGASVLFIPNPALYGRGITDASGTIFLNRLQENQRVLAGYIYGGIHADFPLPAIPNEGTSGSNRLFEVYVTRTPMSVYPSSMAVEAVGTDVPAHLRQ